MKKHLLANNAIQLLFTISILCEIAGKVSAENSGRIVSGSITSINNAKYVVNVRVNGKFTCGGSLVTPRFIVTAAHCVKNVNPSHLMVVGGASMLSESGVRQNVEKIITPKEYNPRTYHSDIAVLKLSGNMSGTNIGTIELCKDNWKLGDFVSVYGWGALSEHNDRETNNLRMVNVPLVTRKRCSEMYRVGGNRITNTMFCAGDLRGKDACSGDSGGPAVFKNQLCGVVSWGVGCGRINFPGVYTSIKTVRNFIDRAMKL